MSYNEEDLDPLVIPMVKYFNDNGLKTIMSCQGHNRTDASMFWIQFDDSVTSEDIQGFMKRHLDQYGIFRHYGQFAKNMNGCYNVVSQKWNIIEAWRYLAATPEAADADLKNWNSAEDVWQGFNAEPYVSWRKNLLAKSGRLKSAESD